MDGIKYHVVRLNQLEQGWVSWDYQEEKLHVWHALIWHLATTSTTPAVPTSPPSEAAALGELWLQCTSEAWLQVLPDL